MTPVEIIATVVPPVVTVIGAVVGIGYRLGRQDQALEFLMRRSEEEARRGGSIPPPRQKLVSHIERR